MARTTTQTLDELKNADVLDSRDVIARIEALEGLDTPNEDEMAELATLRAFADACEGRLNNWQYGETFIQDSYFEDYARDLAEDIGAIKSDAD